MARQKRPWKVQPQYEYLCENRRLNSFNFTHLRIFPKGLCDSVIYSKNKICQPTQLFLNLGAQITINPQFRHFENFF